MLQSWRARPARVVGSRLTKMRIRRVWSSSRATVNQFPGYPLQGSYRVAGQTLNLQATSGESLPKMYLQQHDKRHYLLTAEQFETWEATGKHEDCALVLGGN